MLLLIPSSMKQKNNYRRRQNVLKRKKKKVKRKTRKKIKMRAIQGEVREFSKDTSDKKEKEEKYIIKINCISSFVVLSHFS